MVLATGTIDHYVENVESNRSGAAAPLRFLSGYAYGLESRCNHSVGLCNLAVARFDRFRLLSRELLGEDTG